MSVHPQRSIWLLARMCHTDTAYYEEKEARLNKTPEKEAKGNMKLMYVEEKNE